MLRLRWLCLLAALLAGCLNYKIKVATIVRPDGSFDRTVFLRCLNNVEHKKDGELTEDPPTWSSFEEPVKPYALSGSHAEGFTAKATFEAGEHPSGIRRRAVEEGDDWIEGRAAVEVSDLMVGKLYSYREVVAVGGDPVRFRKELREWLEIGVRIYVEALRREMPQADFDPVLENARKRLAPRVEASLFLLHDQLERLVRRFRTEPALFAPDDPAALMALPEVRLVLSELEKYGIQRDPNRPLPISFDELMSDDAWEFEPTLVREFLMPLRGVSDEEREELVQRIIQNETEPDPEAAFELLYPDEAERKRIEEKFQEFVVASVGGWICSGIFDNHELTLRVRMPGRLLATDGELGESAEVVWHLNDSQLIFSDPELHAVSFVAAEGQPEAGWSLTRLTELRTAIRKLDEKQRARLAALHELARKDGWTRIIEKAESDEPVKLQEALKHLRDAMPSKH